MKRQKITAILLSIILASSVCIQISPAGVFAAEQVEMSENTDALEIVEEDATSVTAGGSLAEENIISAAEETEESEPAGLSEEAESAEGIEPEEPAVPSDEIESAEEIEPEDLDGPSEETGLAEPAETAERTEETESAGTAEETEPAETTEPAKPTEETEPAEMAETAEPAETSGKADTSETAELSEPIEIIERAAPIVDSGRIAKGAETTITVDDILSREIIPTDASTNTRECMLVGVPGTYVAEQDAALARINEIRWEACKEGVRNPETGYPLTTDNYVEMKWSRDMEYIARIRAAETAFSGDHDRLNNKSIWGLVGPDGYRSYTEAIDWNYTSSMLTAIESWYQEKDNWVYRTDGPTLYYVSLIDPSNLYIGIGTFLTEGTAFPNTTIAEFNYKSGLDETRMSFSGDCVQMLEMCRDNLGRVGEIVGKLKGEIGEHANHLLATKTNYYYGCTNVYLMGDVDWSSMDDSVVWIDENGQTEATGRGSTELRAYYYDGSIYAKADFYVKLITDCEISLSSVSFTYDGKAKKPAVTVIHENTKLKEGDDYSLSYKNNVNAGTASVTITGEGTFSGSVTRTFTIKKAPQNIKGQLMSLHSYEKEEVQITGAHGTLTYNSNDTAVAAVEKDGTVTAGKAGTTSILVKAAATSNYNAGSTMVDVRVTACDLSDAQCTAELAKTSYVYDGKAKKPAATVKYDGITLTKDTDYTVSYKNNVNVGTAAVTITGNGTTATGSKTLDFKITKASQTITADTLNILVADSAKAAVEGAKGTLSYDIADPAIATVDEDGTVTGVKKGSTELTISAASTKNYKASNTIVVAVKVTLPGKTSRGDMFNLANNVKVTWEAVPGAKYYKVYRTGITDPKETLKEPVIVTNWLIGWDQQPGLTNGHAYKYTIVASTTGKGDSRGDSEKSYSKIMYRLKTVVIRSAKNTAPGKVTVKYDRTVSGDSYVLQYGEREDMVGAKTKVVLGAENTSYTIGGLKKGKTYYISIRVRKKVDGIDYYTTFGVAKKIKITK